MPNLNCSVESCKYQKENLCSARAINIIDSGALINSFQVNGVLESSTLDSSILVSGALESSDTHCRTYTYADSAVTSSTHHAEEEIKIICDVLNCTHNNNHKCNAKLVEINDYDAKSIEATECSSFLIK